MSTSPGTPSNPTPADSLPPVEPPNAGFIIQLFVIPAVIVTIIVIVWGLFTWLAHMGRDPRSYVEALKRNNESRWQEAFNLSNELRKSGNEELKKDGALALELANMLQAEIDRGGYDQNPVTLRVYLSLVLGQFQVPDVLPALLRAAGTQRDEREAAVRLAALQGLAQLIPNLDRATVQRDDALYETLLKASQESDAVVRHHAAFDLGMLGGERAVARLKSLQSDPDLEVRINAAYGLARNGDASCVELLAQMIDPADPLVPDAQRAEWTRTGKTPMIRANALNAAVQLVGADPNVDVAPLAAAVDKLIQSGPRADVRAKAEEVKLALARRGTTK